MSERRVEGGFGLPADFLIAGGGRILACKYASHANDQWSVDDVLDLANTVNRDSLALNQRIL